jgi:tetratricopeptide (TPR) repeat protein
MHYSAIEIMEALKDTSELDSHGYSVLMLAYNYANKDNEAIQLYKEWENKQSLVNEASINEKTTMYSGASMALSHIERFEESILMMEKYIDAVKEIDDKNGLVDAYAIMSDLYERFGEARKALKYINDAISLKMYIFDISFTDILNEKICNKDLADFFQSAARLNIKMNYDKDFQRYLTLSCACGNEKAMDILSSYGVNYKRELKSLKKELKNKFSKME